MAIIDLQRTIPEAGRIRIGQQVTARNGRTIPSKLDTFRFTSADRRRIEEVAAMFGGTVRPWAAPAGPQWEVVTTTTEIEVIVPPQAMAFSQHYELWSAGGCQRRCDGQTEHLSQQPCLCDPDDRAARVEGTCEIHTRLSLMIRDLPGLGLWRLDTQGWYAARELAGSVEVIALAAGRGIMIPARLLLEQRSVKRPGKDGKAQTLRFPVPRLDPGITPGELLLGGGPAAVPVAALTDGAPPERRLTPVPQIEGPRPSIAEQSAPPQPPPARRNAAPEIPASGRRRSATPPKVEGDKGYWQARAFAEAAERGLEADAVRDIAASAVGAEPDASFSMSSLSEADWERVHRLIPGFAGVAPQGDAATEPEAPVSEPTDAESEAPGPSEADTPGALTSEAFTAWLDEHRISVAYARSIAASMFPGAKKLDDAQRAALRDALAKED